VTCDAVINSTFPLPNHTSFSTTKYIRFFHTTSLLFGKVFVVNLGIKLNVMTLLYLDGPTSHPEPLTFTHYCIIVICFVAFLLRNVDGFKWMWIIIKYFFLALALILIGDQIKKSIKEWWNKD
jgi:hypothetical protein